MSDTEPRPMPARVQRAYRDPMDLYEVLISSVYSDEELLGTLNALATSLSERHGDVWIQINDSEETVRDRVRRMVSSNSFMAVLRLLHGIEEYGGKEGVNAELARLMQPRFAEWWGRFRWNGRENVSAWMRAVNGVVGDRQFQWLLAQYARVALVSTRGETRRIALRAIEAGEAEARAPFPTEEILAESYRAQELAGRAWDSERTGSVREALVAASFAAKGLAAPEWGLTSRSSSFATAVDCAAAAISDRTVAGPSDYSRLAEVTRSLITPTLITSASGAARSSGGVAPRAFPAILGVVAGAGAVLLKKKRG